MSVRIWRPISQIDNNRYLYHYTSMEKACSILFTNELWFSNLTATNDIFEQKVKISFSKVKGTYLSENEYAEYMLKVKKIRDYMNLSRSRIRLLCFSRDIEFSEEASQSYSDLMKQLPSEYRAINVIGRGFSLPRMWAQYAVDNKGVCFIFDKEAILKKVEKSGHNYMYGNVDYRPLYSPYSISLEEFLLIDELIDTKFDDALKTMIRDNNGYLRYDFFSKLSDWSSENEFRIILTNNAGEGVVKLKDIKDAIKGIVVGSEIDKMNTKILKYFSADFDVRKIVYEDVITRIVKEE